MHTRRAGGGPERRGADPAHAAALRRAAAAAREARAREAAGDAPGAAEILAAAVAEVGALGVLTVPLAGLLERLGRWDDLARLCAEAAAACADAREAAGWQLRRAGACEALGDAESAVLAYGASLAARPRHRPALEALQRLHRARGDWAALARALEEELALRVGAEEIPLRLDLAQILETRLAQGSDALVHLRRVVDLDPASGETLARALALAESLGAAAEQVSLLEVALQRSTTACERARLLARQAALLAGPLANPSASVPRWREAVRLGPALQGAHEGLRAALEQLQDWPALLDCLLDAARGLGDDARRAILERAAILASERLGADAALPWLERMRAQAPADARLVARIAALHRAAGRTGALLASLEAELALAPAPERVIELEAERAALLAAMCGRPRGAAPAARGAPDARGGARTPRPTPRHAPSKTALRPGPPAALETPQRGDDGTGRRVADSGGALSPADAAAAAERELASLDASAPAHAERRRALGCRLAHLYADALGEPERALPHLRAIADAPPAARGIAALEREREWAEARLAAILRADGSAPELAERLAARLARTPADADTWLELADLHEHRLFAPSAAARAYREALAHGAARGRALQGLRRASEALGDWEEAARVLEAEAAEETAPDRRAELLRRLGEIAWRRLGATTRASRAFAGALENDPHDLVSLRALQQLLASMEDWRGALDLVESEIELLPHEARDARAELWLRAAEISARRLQDFERAIRALDAAAALRPLGRDHRILLAECLWHAGALARYADVATALCDEPEAAKDADAALRLARALHALGRFEEARERCKRALSADPRVAGAWDLLAEIRLAQGAPSDAAASLARAAEDAAPSVAVERLLRAASLAEAGDLEYAHSLREHACRHDPGSHVALAARAASALALGRLEEAVHAAARAAELALASGARENAAALVDSVRVVAAHARKAGLVLDAARLLEDARLLAPESPDLLRAHAELLFHIGDRRGARHAVRALFARDDASHEDAHLVAIDAEGLAFEGDLDAAAERFAEAVRLDASLEAAWDGLAHTLEGAGHPGKAIAALDAWAKAVSPDASVAIRLRAAEIALAHETPDSAAPRLSDVLHIDPGCARAARLLAALLLARSRAGEALTVATNARARVSDPLERAALARIRAESLEALGRVAEACDAWSDVLRDEPAAADAARARAAWQRAGAAWQDAATGLEAFLAASQDAPDAALADVWFELAQLRAGPLADAEGARAALGECLRLQPGCGAARAQLADLLARDPSRADEAAARHAELLEQTPDRAGSLRALVRLAADRGRDDAAHDGRTLLGVIGGAPDGARLRLPVAAHPALANPVWERARRLAGAAAPEVSRALGASLTIEPPEPSGPVEAFRLAAVVAEAELAGAALVPLRDEETGAVISTLAALAAGCEVLRGDGRLVNALAPQLGRAVRRRLREILGDTTPAEIAEIDFRAWRIALRDLANAVALDATRGDLQAALDALGSDAKTGRSPAARELLRTAALAFARAAGSENAQSR